MSRARRVLPWALGCALLVVMARPAQAAPLAEAWAATPGGSPDGAALGDMDGDGRPEIALVLRGGTYDPGGSMAGVGTLAVINHDGSMRWQVSPGGELVGFPTFGDLDGDGLDEVVVCEVGYSAHCYAYDEDQSEVFAPVGPFRNVAQTNAGPVIADLDGNGYDDIVLAGYNGTVDALMMGGPPDWSYDLGATHGDGVFGHVAAADIDLDGVLEIVLGGVWTGGIYVLNGDDGSEQWALPNLYGSYQNYFFGSGPIVANIDGDPQLEVIAAMAGYPGPSAVLAIDHDGSATPLWRTEVAHDLVFSSPAAADTDGDGVVDVFVQALDGTLMKLAASDGAELQSIDLSNLVNPGDQSWTTPVFVDTDYDGSMEIATATVSAAFVLDDVGGALIELDRYENQAAGLFPSPLVGDADSDGRLELLIGAWFPRQFVAVELPYAGGFRWSTLGGAATHHGSVAPGDAARMFGSDPGATMVALAAGLERLSADAFAGAPPQSLLDASAAARLAVAQYLRGDAAAASTALQDALAQLQGTGVAAAYADLLAHAEAAASHAEQQLMAQWSERTGALAGCNAGFEGEYLVAQCALQSIHDALSATLGAGDAAVLELETCVGWIPDLALSNALLACQSGIEGLDGVAPAEQQAIASALAHVVRAYLDDVGGLFSDAASLQVAETAYADALVALSAGGTVALSDAVGLLVDALAAAMPCPDEPTLLMAGGCIPPIVCGAGETCTPSCGSGQQCTVDCIEANSCDATCSSGSDCGIDCTAAIECIAECRGGSDCGINCTDAIDCIPECSSGSDCGILCEGTNNCDATCESGADCTLSCIDANNCRIDCLTGSDCNVDCSGANHCDQIICRGGAKCIVHCDGIDNCAFDRCQGTERVCGDYITCDVPCDEIP